MHWMKTMMTKIFEKRPLKTDSDYAKIMEFIEEVGRKVQGDVLLKNQLLAATGIYNENGVLKRIYDSKRIDNIAK